MSIDISSKNETRLRATAQAEGVSVDACVEGLMNKREELAAMVTKRTACPPSRQKRHALRLTGFLQSERGAVVDGETFSSESLIPIQQNAPHDLRRYREDRVRLQTGVPATLTNWTPERRALKESIEREDSRRAAQGFDEGASMQQGPSPIRDPV